MCLYFNKIQLNIYVCNCLLDMLVVLYQYWLIFDFVPCIHLGCQLRPAGFHIYRR